MLCNWLMTQLLARTLLGFLTKPSNSAHYSARGHSQSREVRIHSNLTNSWIHQQLATTTPHTPKIGWITKKCNVPEFMRSSSFATDTHRDETGLEACTKVKGRGWARSSVGQGANCVESFRQLQRNDEAESPPRWAPAARELATDSIDGCSARRMAQLLGFDVAGMERKKSWREKVM